jgi:hypothetical protein
MAAIDIEELSFDHFVTALETPPPPISALKGSRETIIGVSTGSTEVLRADGGMVRQGSADSGYKSKESSRSEDQIKADIAAAGILEALTNGLEAAVVD